MRDTAYLFVLLFLLVNFVYSRRLIFGSDIFTDSERKSKTLLVGARSSNQGGFPNRWHQLIDKLKDQQHDGSPNPCAVTTHESHIGNGNIETSTYRQTPRFLSALKGGANDKKRILILMSDTGGGHRASAQAIDQALQEQYPGKVDVNIMDIWTDHAGWPYNKFVPVYRFLAKHPMLWRGFYLYGMFPPTKFFTELASQRNSYKSFERAIVSADPDFVLSVHPLCQLMPLSIVRTMNKKRPASKPPIPFVTVVTDLGGAHSTWFDKRVDACFVPSEAVRRIALRNGIPAEKLIMKGLPIRPSFWKPSQPKEEVRKALNLSLGMKTVMLMGGGDGVGGIGPIALQVARKLQKLDIPSQLIVICGHNKVIADQLRNKLQDTKLFQPVVKGFVNNIDEYMTASDCLVTKAGPGTIAESMIRGLPLVLSSYLPGQEYGNVPYVVDGGFGIYTGNKPKKIANTVGALFTNEERLEKMSELARQKSRPEATKNIATDIGEALLHHRKFSSSG